MKLGWGSPYARNLSEDNGPVFLEGDLLLGSLPGMGPFLILFRFLYIGSYSVHRDTFV